MLSPKNSQQGDYPAGGQISIMSFIYIFTRLKSVPPLGYRNISETEEETAIDSIKMDRSTRMSENFPPTKR